MKKLLTAALAILLAGCTAQAAPEAVECPECEECQECEACEACPEVEETTLAELPANVDTTKEFKPDPEKDETKPCEATIYNPGCAAINKDNIDQYLNREDVLYIDTRDYEAYAAKHFRNFECIPFFALVYAMDGSKGVQLYHSDENNTKEPVPTYEESDDVLEMLFPKDKTLFLMCQSGGRVAMLMNILEARGWDMSKVYNITGMGSLIENAKLAEDVVVLEDQFNDVLKVEYGFANLTPVE